MFIASQFPVVDIAEKSKRNFMFCITPVLLLATFWQICSRLSPLEKQKCLFSKCPHSDVM